MKNILAALILLVLTSDLPAQDSTAVAKQYQMGSRFLPCIGVNNVFLGDYLLGFGGGMYERTHNYSARINFDFRPYFKSVTFEENDTLRQQYKEKDFYFNLSLEKQFRLKSQYPMLLPFVQLNLGLLWGNFKAFDKAPENKWVISPAAGLNLAINSVVNFKLGYQYLKPLVLQTSAHRIVLQVLFIIDDLE